MFSTILKAIIALPKILDSLAGLIKMLEKQFGPDWNAAIVRISDAYNKLEKAQSSEERDDALKSIAGAWSGKPKS